MVSELLLPAGSPVKLKTAILYGADAVYAGTPDMSLRTQSQFSLDDIREGIDFVHAAGKKIYLTLNLYTHNKDVEKLPHFVDTLRRLKPDGVLIADPGVFLYLKEHAPELKRFVSTRPTSVPTRQSNSGSRSAPTCAFSAAKCLLPRWRKSADNAPISCLKPSSTGQCACLIPAVA